MDAPLAAERTITEGHQQLAIWTDGTRRLVDPPIDPYCYAKTPFEEGPIEQRQVTRKALSTLEPAEWTRASFANVDDLSTYAHAREESEIAEAHIPFVHRVLLDEPDFYRDWANGAPSRLYFDIEQLTTGERFPTSEDPIVAIAWAVDDAEPTCVTSEDEAHVLEAFASAIDEHDPDVLAGYNVKGYDVPRLLARFDAHEIPEEVLVREGGRIGRDRFSDDPRLVSRVLYDVYEAVRADRGLVGIKNRKLDTVAEWHDLEVVEADVSRTAELVGTDELRRYTNNDVHLAREIGEPYLANEIELADFYGAPLQTVVEATPSFHCTTLQGRVFVEEGVISDGRNDKRFPELYEQTGGEGFVGGIVEIHQRGRFAPVTLVDFASMYPSILVALGAGADNTRYRGTIDPGGYEARRRGDTLDLAIPDPARETRHRVTIEGKSPLAEDLAELLAYRLDLKSQAGEGDSRAETRQGVVKVILNSVYGVMASRHARYASLPVAMAIVGTARQLIRTVEDELGEAKIETDTDGVYADGHVDPKPLEAKVNRFVEEQLGGDPVLALDADTFEAGYFHEGKNYLLLHEDGRLERHGVAFKGSSRAELFDEALETTARALLEGRDDVDEVASQAMDLSAYEPEQFVMRVRLGKDPDDYAATNHVAAQVARAAQEKGREVSQGDQIPYIKTTDGYDVATETAFERLDEAYYREQLSDLLERLGIAARPADQVSLDEFL